MTLVVVVVSLGILAFLLLMRMLWGTTKIRLNSKIVLLAASVLGGALLIATLSGKFHPLAAVGMMILPFVRRALGLLSFLPFLSNLTFSGNRGGSPFDNLFNTRPNESSSSTQTADVAMTLDHETGTIDGKVLRGRLKGRTLSELSDQQIVQLHEQLGDTESRRLLEAYIVKHRSHLMSDEQTPTDDTSQAELTVARAAEILGIEISASKEEIVAAHRRLMQKLHPDQGGSAYLAAELNRAKELLMRQFIT